MLVCNINKNCRLVLPEIEDFYKAQFSKYRVAIRNYRDPKILLQKYIFIFQYSCIFCKEYKLMKKSVKKKETDSFLNFITPVTPVALTVVRGICFVILAGTTVLIGFIILVCFGVVSSFVFRNYSTI